MPHWLMHGMAIVPRVMAGLIGCVCFYVAFFLFENEDGVWQDRIDNLWISIHERARFTRSDGLAFFNRLGDVMLQFFNSLFGHKLLSVRAALMSITVSTITVVLVLSWRSAFLLGHWGSGIVLTMIATLLARWIVLMIRHPRRWIYVTTCLTILLIYGFLWEMYYVFDSSVVATDGILFLDILLSIVCDFIAVVVLRRTISFLSRSLSQFGALLSIAGLTIAAALFDIGLPTLVGNLPIAKSFHPTLLIPGASELLEWQNLSTTIYYLVPNLIIAALLLHLAFWPLINRLVYPLVRFKVATNRKVLVPVGCLSFLFAFKIEHIGLKELLKLFS